MFTALHVTAVCATGALVLYADEQALLWILGKKRVMQRATVHFLHNAVAIGLAAIILTGAVLFLRAPAYYLAQPAFIAKMIAVGALIINTYFIDRLSGIALTRPFSHVSSGERVSLFLSGTVSVAGWVTALIGGLVLG